MIRIHAIRTQRPHWGEHSGSLQFVKHIDRKRFLMNIYEASDSDADFPFRNEELRIWLRKRVQQNGMGFYKLSDLVAEWKAAKRIMGRKIDILHYLDGEHTAQYLPRLFHILPKGSTRLIASFHQPPELLASLTIKSIVSRLDFAVLVSPQQLMYFGDLLPENRIVVILHGIDTKYFYPAETKRNSNHFRCITVGHWLRDFQVLKETAKKLANEKDIEFRVITSKRTGPQFTGLEDMKNVSLFREHLEDAQLLEEYQNADLLFLPLTDATANNALLEGIACGLPVLTTDLPSMREYVPGDEAILIQGNQPQDFADAILHLRNHSSIRQKMGNEARKRALELDWSRIVGEYESLYLNAAQ